MLLLGAWGISFLTREKVKLPEPKYDSGTSIEQALLKRRSVREYKNEPLTLMEVGQLLWSAQGITDRVEGFRTAPSAGALYPIEVYVVIGNVKSVNKGVYKYIPYEHAIVKVKDADVRNELASASLGQLGLKKGQ